MSFESVDPGHGHSTAAWTAVTIMLAAFTVGTVAFFLDLPWLVWASTAVFVLGLVAGWIMSKIGYGVADATTANQGH